MLENVDCSLLSWRLLLCKFSNFTSNPSTALVIGKGIFFPSELPNNFFGLLNKHYAQVQCCLIQTSPRMLHPIQCSPKGFSFICINSTIEGSVLLTGVINSKDHYTMPTACKWNWVHSTALMALKSGQWKYLKKTLSQCHFALHTIHVDQYKAGSLWWQACQ